MGSRGAFENVDMGNFSFKEGGQHYFSIGELSGDKNVKVIIQDSKKSEKRYALYVLTKI